MSVLHDQVVHLLKIAHASQRLHASTSLTISLHAYQIFWGEPCMVAHFGVA